MVPEDEERILAAAVGKATVTTTEIAAATCYSVSQIGQTLRKHGWIHVRPHRGPKYFKAPPLADVWTATTTHVPMSASFVIDDTPAASTVVTPPSPAHLGRRILVIPDTQVKPGVPVQHLTWAGKYIAEKRPDYIVHLGDHWDMPSLSSYDKGKRSFEGRRYQEDVKAGNHALQLLTREYRGISGYAPEEHFLDGNHEWRIVRATENQAELEGTIGLHHLDRSGWTVHPFLSVLMLEGIKFSHYFTSGLYGRPVSSAAVLLRTAAGSAVMGHTQKVDMAIHEKNGAIALMAGTFYQHNEDYLGPQGNACRRQLVMLNECRDGIFDPMFVSLGYLRGRFS
jgi:hypothetical protein